MTSLTIAEAVPLGAALAVRVARDEQIRVLLIKGHPLTAQGLRGPHEPVDVDVLVDPQAFDRYVAVMKTLGWLPLGSADVPRVLDHHAVTLTHPLWPITLDVHHRFPGFHAPPDLVFEAFWQRREGTHSATVAVDTPDRVGHLALTALHHLRSATSELSRDRLADLSQRGAALLTASEDQQDFLRFAIDTGSVQSLAPFFALLRVAPPREDPFADPKALDAWQLNTVAAPSTGWLLALTRTPTSSWPAFVGRALWPSSSEIDAHHRTAGETRLRARIRRWRKGAANAPGACRSLWQHSTRQRSQP